MNSEKTKYGQMLGRETSSKFLLTIAPNYFFTSSAFSLFPELAFWSRVRTTMSVFQNQNIFRCRHLAFVGFVSFIGLQSVRTELGKRTWAVGGCGRFRHTFCFCIYSSTFMHELYFEKCILRIQCIVSEMCILILITTISIAHFMSL